MGISVLWKSTNPAVADGYDGPSMQFTSGHRRPACRMVAEGVYFPWHETCLIGAEAPGIGEAVRSFGRDTREEGPFGNPRNTPRANLNLTKKEEP
jgi:hypothetical protein